MERGDLGFEGLRCVYLLEEPLYVLFALFYTKV
jgi:hypothetical protein